MRVAGAAAALAADASLPRVQGLPLTETSNHFQAQATIDGVVQARLPFAARLLRALC